MLAAAKLIVIGVGLALIALSAGGIFLYVKAESTLKGALERRVSASLGVPATLGGVAFAPGRGAIVLTDFAIANPEGFEAANALTCERIVVEPDFASLFTSEPRLKRLRFEGVSVDLRHEAGAGVNLSVLASLARGDGGTPDAEPAGEVAPVRGAAARAFVVDRFEIEGAELAAASDWLPEERRLALDIDRIALDDVRDGEALTADQIVAVLLQSLARQAPAENALVERIQSLLGRE